MPATADPSTSAADPAVAEFLAALRGAARQIDEGHESIALAQAGVADAYRRLMNALLTAPVLVPADEVCRAFADLVDDVDRTILRGLNDGLSRAALHTRLGISRRDIDERIPHLHRLAGTTNQFQLGRAAFALGWLDQPGSTEPQEPS